MTAHGTREERFGITKLLIAMPFAVQIKAKFEPKIEEHLMKKSPESTKQAF